MNTNRERERGEKERTGSGMRAKTGKRFSSGVRSNLSHDYLLGIYFSEEKNLENRGFNLRLAWIESYPRRTRRESDRLL